MKIETVREQDLLLNKGSSKDIANLSYLDEFLTCNGNPQIIDFLRNNLNYKIQFND